MPKGGANAYGIACVLKCVCYGGRGKGAACVLTVVGANEDARVEPHRVDMEVCLAVAPERGRKEERTGKNQENDKKGKASSLYCP